MSNLENIRHILSSPTKAREFEIYYLTIDSTIIGHSKYQEPDILPCFYQLRLSATSLNYHFSTRICFRTLKGGNCSAAKLLIHNR